MRRGVLLLGAIGVLAALGLTLVYSCFPWDAYRYRESRLKGHSSTEVLAALGKPYYDSRIVEGNTAQKFAWGYTGRGGWLGSTYMVYFEDDRVVRTEALGVK